MTLYRDKGETISQRSKLMLKEYKTRHDWVGKVIHWEMSKKVEFDHLNKWYTPNSILENKMYKALWDFEVQTNHLISARGQDLIIINKKKWKSGE